MQCNECGREDCIDYFIILRGKVLCINCSIQYMIDRLEYINKILNEIQKRLERYEDH